MGISYRSSPMRWTLGLLMNILELVSRLVLFPIYATQRLFMRPKQGRNSTVSSVHKKQVKAKSGGSNTIKTFLQERRPRVSFSKSHTTKKTMELTQLKSTEQTDFYSKILKRDESSLSTSTEMLYPRRSLRFSLYAETTASGFEDLKSISSNIRILPCKSNPAGLARQFISTKQRSKYLVLDLDETLIHSMVKGGKVSTGHMVEVKLNRDQAILFYVYKRPYCDYFLRMEYADPVLDWLEQDRSYFQRRYYRQHCTLVDGFFVKDLRVLDIDLSQVFIIDNSPLCYLMNEDNAIPIEGWINDPTDKHLLHLVPLLQGIRHVNDVRTILSLRLGIHDLT